MTETWGKSLSSKKVHLYINGKMVCHRASRGHEHIDGQMPFENWDIDDPDTCPKCKAWAKMVKKGFTIVKIRTDSHPLTSSS